MADTCSDGEPTAKLFLGANASGVARWLHVLVAMQPIIWILPDGVDVLLYADGILLVFKRVKSVGLH